MGYYEETQPTYRVNVLGTEYSVFMNVPIESDSMLEHCAGYCDKTTKRVVVAAKCNECELSDFSVYEKTNLRHELIHAFLFESGLDGNSCWENHEVDHPEQIVQWMALQFPKIIQVFQQVNAL